MLGAILAKIVRPDRSGRADVAAVVSNPEPDLAQRVADLRAYLREQPRDQLGNLIYPDDENEVADWFPALAEVCLLTGQAQPRWPTRRALNKAIALCAASLAPVAVTPVELPQLDAAVAAEQFVEWLRRTNQVGVFDTDRLSRAYKAHCEQHRLTPCPEETLRKHLSDVDGVKKGMVEAGKIGNRRRRRTEWIISRPVKAARRVEPLGIAA